MSWAYALTRQALVWVAFLGIAFAQTNTPLFCAVPGKEDPKDLTGVVNTYYPGAVSAAAGSTSVTLGIPRGDTSVGITPGDMLLIIQVQDAGIITANDATYGGYDAAKGGVNNAGKYEYLRATSTLAAGVAGSVTFQGGGTGGGLLFAYSESDATATFGQRRFQVVRVPQYSSATVTGAVTSVPWDGRSGGIVALDVAGKLNFGPAGSVDVTGQGFRGGGAVRTSGIAGVNTPPLLTPADYVSRAQDSHGTKGEGIAGTPLILSDGALSATPGQTDQFEPRPAAAGGEGYPRATGSNARGAAANAGGGATDGMPRNSGTIIVGGKPIDDGNGFNAGGGGGANAGAGGNGGANFARKPLPFPAGDPNNFRNVEAGSDIGGRGGKSIVTASARADRLFLGGGGGSGSINDNLAYSASGADGGGMVLIRADSVTGAGAIKADGNSASNILGRAPICCDDGAGGGGAGGTVLVETRNASGVANLTITAKGGNGGNTRRFNDPAATADMRHGPGGGGGGGAVYTTGAAGAGSSVAGGVNGITVGGDTFKALPGSAGFINNALAPDSIPGGGAGFECIPNLTITKVASTPTVPAGATTLSYTIRVSNAAGLAAATGLNILDVVPTPFTYVPGSATYVTTGGATGPTPVPATGNVVFGVARGDATNSFSIPGGASVALTYTVNLNGAAPDTYKNSATARYLDPQRTSPATSPLSEKEVGPVVAPVTIGGLVEPPSRPKANDDETITPLNKPVTFGAVNQPGDRNVPPPAYNDVPTPGTNLVPTTIDLDPSTPGQQTTKTVPGKGKFDLNPDGSVTFTPEPGFVGTVSIPYTIDDNSGQRSNSADLKVTIIPPPVANPDKATTAINTPVVLDAPANDVAGQGARLVPGSIDLDPSVPGQQTTKVVPGQGTFTLNPDGTVTFTPENGFTGTVSIPYTIKDTLGQESNQTTLTVVINPLPSAVDDRVRTPLNTPVTIPFGANDVPNAGATINQCTVDLDPSTPAQETTVTIVGKGTFTRTDPPTCNVVFTPVNGYTGTAEVPYTVQDSTGGRTAPATIHVTIVPPPAAGDDATTTPLNTPVTFGSGTVPAPVANDLAGNGAVLLPSTIDLDPATPGQQTTKTTPEGTFTLDVATGNVTFAPVAGFVGTATTPYTIKDDLGQTSNVAKISVTIAPVAPTAAPDYATTPINTPVKLNPIENDNGNGVTLDPCTIDLDPATPGQQTSFTVNGKGTFVLNPSPICDVTFTPENGFTGTVSTPYTIAEKGNPGNVSNPATLNVTVNAKPAAQPDKTRTPYNTPVTFGVGGVPSPSSNDVAPDGKSINASSIDLDPSTPGEDKVRVVPGQGRWEAGANGNVTFTPEPGFTGVATIPYVIKDSSGQLTNVTTLTVIVDPPTQPIANPDKDETPYNTPITLDPSKNDTAAGGLNKCSIDLDPGSPGQQTIFTVAGKGTFVLNPAPACDVTFTPVDGFIGTVTIPYTIEDNLGQRSNPADITVVVRPPEIKLEKTASQTSVKIGSTLDYTLKLTNGAGKLTNVQIIDTLPVGLVYVDGSSKIGGVAVADPVKTVVGNQQVLTWNSPDLNAGEGVVLSFSTKVTSAVQNPIINKAEARGILAGTTTKVTSVASATTRIDDGVFSPNGEILGRVYFDRNNDNNFTQGTDEPLQGARVYLSNGRFAVTDDLGRYSITNVEPGLYAIRIDRLTAPYVLRPVPDDQAQRGTRYVRIIGAGIDHEDFIFGPPNADTSRVRATRVTRGGVTVEKAVTQLAANAYTITLTITVEDSIKDFSLKDPLPPGATRAGLAGPGLQPTEAAGSIELSGILQPGNYTLAYTLNSNLPLDQVVTDPDLYWDEVTP